MEGGRDGGFAHGSRAGDTGVGARPMRDSCPPERRAVAIPASSMLDAARDTQSLMCACLCGGLLWGGVRAIVRGDVRGRQDAELDKVSLPCLLPTPPSASCTHTRFPLFLEPQPHIGPPAPSHRAAAWRVDTQRRQVVGQAAHAKVQEQQGGSPLPLPLSLLPAPTLPLFFSLPSSFYLPLFLSLPLSFPHFAFHSPSASTLSLSYPLPRPTYLPFPHLAGDAGGQRLAGGAGEEEEEGGGGGALVGIA
jgi:hypothetical protein